MSSLKDQLFSAGLVDKQAVKNTRKQKQPKARKKDRGQLSDSAKMADKTRLEKAQHDKELNRQRQIEADNKALQAQIKQLIEGSKIEREDADLAYSFSVTGKIKKIYVSAEQQKQLARDQICIAVLANERFELVPKVVAVKIAQRDESYLVNNAVENNDALTEDDPYADYQIPDDLVW